MQVVLVMFRTEAAEEERRSFSVVRDVTVIGRREDCDLRIPVSEVSRKHCRIIKEGQGLKLEDLGSSNGTFHNGHRVQEAALRPGDCVEVGPVVFVVQINGVPPEDDLKPFADRAARKLENVVDRTSPPPGRPTLGGAEALEAPSQFMAANKPDAPIDVGQAQEPDESVPADNPPAEGEIQLELVDDQAGEEAVPADDQIDLGLGEPPSKR